MLGFRFFILTVILEAAAGGQTPADAPLTLSFQDALGRAKANAPQLLSANIAAQWAREEAVQAKAALLPAVSAFSQFIYTQPNGLASGVFVANDGPHVYNDQLVVHGDLYAPGKIADFRKFRVAEE